MAKTTIKIAIASDHAGFELKETIKQYFDQQGITYHDFGTHSTESTDYPDYVHPLAQSISKDEFSLGIVICGSGNGVNMTANKYPQIRSALCWLPELAELARQHNDANVLALPARFIDHTLALQITQSFLSSSFEGGRHQNRVNKIPCK